MKNYLGCNLRMLVQRQYRDPSAVEMTLYDVRRLELNPVGAIILGTETFVEDDYLGMEFVEGATLVFGRMEYRFASEWMGPGSRFGSSCDGNLPNLVPPTFSQE